MELKRSLSAATCQAAVEACQTQLPSEVAKHILLEICDQFLHLHSRSTFGASKPASPYSASLTTLHERLSTGKLAPSPLRTHTTDEDKTRQPLTQRTGKQPLNRPLEDFEDLYYALLAKIQEIYQEVHVRVHNAFAAPEDLVFNGGPTFTQVQGLLEVFWRELNEVSLVKALDAAVRRGRIKAMHSEILEWVGKGEMSKEDADRRVEELWGSSDEVMGLAWIGGWAPSMIRAWLDEKYRVVLRAEQEACEPKRKQRLTQEERRRREKKNIGRKQPRIREFDKQMLGQEMELEKTALDLRAENVKEYGRWLRQCVGGDEMGLRNNTWTVYGDC